MNENIRDTIHQVENGYVISKHEKTELETYLKSLTFQLSNHKNYY